MQESIDRGAVDPRLHVGRRSFGNRAPLRTGWISCFAEEVRIDCRSARHSHASCQRRVIEFLHDFAQCSGPCELLAAAQFGLFSIR